MSAMDLGQPSASVSAMDLDLKPPSRDPKPAAEGSGSAFGAFGDALKPPALDLKPASKGGNNVFEAFGESALGGKAVFNLCGAASGAAGKASPRSWGCVLPPLGGVKSTKAPAALAFVKEAKGADTATWQKAFCHSSGVTWDYPTAAR